MQQWELQKVLPKIQVKCLIEARARLDIVNMKLFRMFVATLDLALVGVHVFADGSPQFRGQELFASTIDVNLSPNVRMRRLLPCVSLPRWMADALSKTMALLWQFFLMVGPNFDTMRRWCDRVLSICTDMGAERKMAPGVYV